MNSDKTREKDKYYKVHNSVTEAHEVGVFMSLPQKYIFKVFKIYIHMELLTE